MQLPSAQQLRDWDQFTVRREGISFWDLMERAATVCVDWLVTHYDNNKTFVAICGTGNNGGDGLAIARQLLAKGYTAKAILVQPYGKRLSADAERNLHLLPNDTVIKVDLNEGAPIEPHVVLLDCLFGTGLNRPLGGEYKLWIDHINAHKNAVVSVDLPSGLLSDGETPAEAPVVTATHTLSFETYKLSLLAAANEQFIGDVHILPIGLAPEFWKTQNTQYFITTKNYAQQWYRPRKRFSHKGDFGHAIIMGGSKGMMGAPLMAVESCLRSGVGLCTAVVPGCGYQMMQGKHPEAMCLADVNHECITALPALPQNTTAVCIGPGLGKDERTENAILRFLKETKHPLAIDADGLNVLSRNKSHLQSLPKGSIITPHPKEFSRVFDCGMNWWEQLIVAQQQAQQLEVVIVLKGHHSIIAMPGGAVWFNTTGNSALAKGGSGDVLAGLITGLLAQGYSAPHAAPLGVWLHGRAADLAMTQLAPECFLPTDLSAHLSAAFRELAQHRKSGINH